MLIKWIFLKLQLKDYIYTRLNFIKFKIDYSKYNARKKDKKNEIQLTENEELEMEDFRKFIIEKVHISEKKDRAFSSWLFKYENMKEHIY